MALAAGQADRLSPDVSLDLQWLAISVAPVHRGDRSDATPTLTPFLDRCAEKRQIGLRVDVDQ